MEAEPLRRRFDFYSGDGDSRQELSDHGLDVLQGRVRIIIANSLGKIPSPSRNLGSCVAVLPSASNAIWRRR
jgi:hypothetical protein